MASVPSSVIVNLSEIILFSLSNEIDHNPGYYNTVVPVKYTMHMYLWLYAYVYMCIHVYVREFELCWF